MSEKTIFKKIIDGEVPCTKVYEDDAHLAFLDIGPVMEGHTLVIPKNEYEWIQDMPDDEYSELMLVCKKLITPIKQALGCDYVQMSIVGKDVPHVHVHLIPRFLGDNLPSFEPSPYPKGRAEELQSKLIHAISSQSL